MSALRQNGSKVLNQNAAVASGGKSLSPLQSSEMPLKYHQTENVKHIYSVCVWGGGVARACVLANALMGKFAHVFYECCGWPCANLLFVLELIFCAKPQHVNTEQHSNPSLH